MTRILYHGSRTPGIKELKPFSHKAVGGKEVVFATGDKEYALSMIYGTGDELAVSYAVNPNTRKEEMYVDEIEAGKLSLLNNVGYLYELDPVHFEKSPEKLEGEYVSYKPVPVIKEIKIDNILNYLEQMGVNLIKYEYVPESMRSRGKSPNKPKIEYSEDRFK